jgi:hypothetical protein
MQFSILILAVFVFVILFLSAIFFIKLYKNNSTIKIKYFILILIPAVAIAVTLGFISGQKYNSLKEYNDFKTKAFGKQIKYGILAKEHAFSQLIDDSDRRTRTVVLEYIVKEQIQRKLVIIQKLQEVYGKQNCLDIPPMAALAMFKFNLKNYLNHPNPHQRFAAVYTSRLWENNNKLDVLMQFLNDKSEFVVNQTIYEIGRIGDKKALKVLKESRFDKYSFIKPVRKALRDGTEFRMN